MLFCGKLRSNRSNMAQVEKQILAAQKFLTGLHGLELMHK